MSGSPDIFSKGPGPVTEDTLRVVIAEDSPGLGGGGTFVASATSQSPTAADVEGGHIIYGQSVAGTITLPDGAVVGDRVSVINLADVTTNVTATTLAGRAVVNPTPVVGAGAWATFTYAGANVWNASLDTGPRALGVVEITSATQIIDNSNWQDYHGKVLRLAASCNTLDIQTTIVGFQCVAVYGKSGSNLVQTVTATGQSIYGGSTSVELFEAEVATIAILGNGTGKGDVLIRATSEKPPQAPAPVLVVGTDVNANFGPAQIAQLRGALAVVNGTPIALQWPGMDKGWGFTIFNKAATPETVTVEVATSSVVTIGENANSAAVDFNFAIPPYKAVSLVSDGTAWLVSGAAAP